MLSQKQCHRCNTLADDVGVIGGVSSLVGDSLASGSRCSWTEASLENIISTVSVKNTNSTQVTLRYKFEKIAFTGIFWIIIIYSYVYIYIYLKNCVKSNFRYSILNVQNICKPSHSGEIFKIEYNTCLRCKSICLIWLKSLSIQAKCATSTSVLYYNAIFFFIVKIVYIMTKKKLNFNRCILLY